MLVPDAGVSEDAKLAFAALSADAKHRQFCPGRIAGALTFVSFLARVLRPAHEIDEGGSTAPEIPAATSLSFERCSAREQPRGP